MKNIINMIRLRISEFITKHKDKFKDLGQKLIMVAMGVGIATIILSVSSNINEDKESDRYDVSNVYKPTQTIIKGSDVSKEQFEEDKNLVNTFLEFCNNGKVEEAYNLISDECKEEKYPTLQDFQKFYYNYIFDKGRSFNLQSWISDAGFTVYKIRYTNNMLATGTYDENDVYQDYITLNRIGDTEKISIGSFVSFEECNIVTKTNEIEATVLSKKIYLEEEVYTINIKNNTDKTILLDTLMIPGTINLVANGNNYGAITNGMFVTNFTINPGISKNIEIRFMKNLSSTKKTTKIEFSNVIKDYDTYMQNKEEYTDFTSITVSVRG